MSANLRRRVFNRLAMVVGLSLVLLGAFGLAGVNAAGGSLIWSDGTSGDIFQVDVTGINATKVVTAAASLGSMMDVGTDGVYLYWVDNNVAMPNIGRSDFDGTSPVSNWLDTSVVGERVWGMTLSESYIYWSDSSRDSIYRANIDGSGATELISLTQVYPAASINTYDITMDDTYLYWIDGHEDKLYRSTLDGTHTYLLLDLGTLYNGWYGSTSSRPYGIAVDDTYIYWTDGGPDKIFRAEKDGSNPMVLIDPDSAIAPAGYAPYGITTDGTYLYWADNGTDAIYKANLDGTGAVTLTQTSLVGSSNPRYVAFSSDGATAVTLSRVANYGSLTLALGVLILGTVVTLNLLRRR